MNHLVKINFEGERIYLAKIQINEFKQINLKQTYYEDFYAIDGKKIAKKEKYVIGDDIQKLTIYDYIKFDQSLMNNNLIYNKKTNTQ